jgi:hypothetical protein
MNSNNAGGASIMNLFDGLRAVDMDDVAADDRLIESLRAGMTPTDGGPLGALLARWHGAFAPAGLSHA